ncbi:MAG: glycoside hydrolase family 127 protein, partial [Planctomycetaceae bacterium]|nr:glycoside hydrolase family 127 protein [Planctomycetaceae bacterium]
MLKNQIGKVLLFVWTIAYVLFVYVLTPAGGAAEESRSSPVVRNLTFQAVPFTDVQFDDSFWLPRLKTNREISIPHNYQWCEETGRISNFAKAAKLLNGDFKGIYFNDSDVYKLLEGTAYSLADHPDPVLEKQADDVIAWIAAAQQPDGYLNSYFSLREQDKKWTQVGKHELYCAGHLFEAAVAYKKVTGKDSLLNVAEKFADHIIDVFINKKTSKFDVPGCEVIELALVKLYQQTGKEKYLNLSKHFVDIRGDQSKRRDKIRGVYSQDHQPIREQTEIAGHAVRAAYLYSGATDVAALTNDQSLTDAMKRLWNNTVNQKMYITGGIGSRHKDEAFGNNYELPNKTAYCETCAAISLVFWTQRMNMLTGEAKYADVIERVIYNGMLSGVSLDGKLFFYVNPLEADKIQPTPHDVVKNNNHHRQPFFETACCPTNVIRFLPSLPGYVYATEKGNTIVVNQFVAGKAKIQLSDGEV